MSLSAHRVRSCWHRIDNRGAWPLSAQRADNELWQLVALWTAKSAAIADDAYIRASAGAGPLAPIALRATAPPARARPDISGATTTVACCSGTRCYGHCLASSA